MAAVTKPNNAHTQYLLANFFISNFIPYLPFVSTLGVGSYGKGPANLTYCVDLGYHATTLSVGYPFISSAFAMACLILFIE